MAANINGQLRVAGEILDLKLEKLGADPTGGGLVESRIWYDTVAKAVKLYNGTAVVGVGGGISAEDLADALTAYAQTSDVNTAISNAVQDLVSGTEMQGAIDNALAGLDFQSDVLGLESDFVATAGRYIYVDGSNFATGVAAAAGDIVVVDAAGVITANAYDVSAAGPGALTWNRTSATWYRWNGTDWAEFGGLSGFTTGNGLQSAGDVVSVKAADASIVVDANGVKVGDLSATYVTPAAQATAISGLQSAAQVTAAINAAVADFQDEAEVNALVVAALTDYAKSADVTSEISTAVTGLASTQSVTNAIENALSGLDFQADVLGMENQFAGTPGRYIIIDGAQGLHATTSNTMDIIEVDAGGNETKLAYDVSARGPGALVWNRASSMFMRWDGATWSQFGGISGVTAGNGIEKSGDTISVKAANASITVAAGGISVGDLSGTYVTPAAQTTAINNAVADFITESDLEPITTVINNLGAQVSQSFFAFDSGATSATSHTVNHNIGFRWPIVQVVDKATNTTVIPDSISFTDANSLVITLGVAAAVLVQVSWLSPSA